MTHYYPNHFARTRRYFKEADASLRDLVAAGPPTYRETSGVVARAICDDLARTPGAPEPVAALVSPETGSTLAAIEWRLNGSKVIDVAPRLVQALIDSDLGDVSLSDLAWPQSNFYMHLGTEHELQLPWGPQICGAYVMRHPGVSVRFILVAAQAGPAEWWERAGEALNVMIPARLFEHSLDTAVAEAFDLDRADLARAISSLNDKRSEALIRSNHMLERLQEGQGIYVAGLRLLANALCYLSAYPGDLEEDWQPGAPPRLVAQAKSVLPKEAARAISKLTASGFVRAQRVGLQFAATAQTSSRAAHLRRGHWRRQAHGPEMSLRKIIWIQPTRVIGSGDPEISQ